jgi:UDP-glucose 4-epimerase
MSPYGVSKLATESYALAYSYSFGLQTLALRFFNVYGPRQRSDHDYAAVIPKFLSASLQNQNIVIDGDGTQSRDFTFVGSVCTALVEALKAKLHSQSPINLAFGTNTTINDLVKVIERLSSQAVKVEFANPRVGDVLASRADPRRMRELFPDLKPVPLEEGVQETLEWLKGNLSSPTDLD